MLGDLFRNGEHTLAPTRLDDDLELCMGADQGITTWQHPDCTNPGVDHEPHHAFTLPDCADCGAALVDTGPRCRDCAGPMPPR